MNVFWKTFLGGMLCLALMVGARYGKAWLRSDYRAERVDYQTQRSGQLTTAQATYVAPRPTLPPNYTAPIKPPPFYKPPVKPPNHNSRRN